MSVVEAPNRVPGRVNTQHFVKWTASQTTNRLNSTLPQPISSSWCTAEWIPVNVCAATEFKGRKKKGSTVCSVMRECSIWFVTSLNLGIRRSSFQFTKKLRHRETEKVSQQPKDHAKLLQSCPALWDPVDCSTPGSSVLGILQARILEWVAVPSSRGSSSPRDGTQVLYVSCSGRRVLHHRHLLGRIPPCYTILFTILP